MGAVSAPKCAASGAGFADHRLEGRNAGGCRTRAVPRTLAGLGCCSPVSGFWRAFVSWPPSGAGHWCATMPNWKCGWRAGPELCPKPTRRCAVKFRSVRRHKPLWPGLNPIWCRPGNWSALGQMSAGISHELNQPLMAIRSFAENAIKFQGLNRPDSGCGQS